MIARGSFDGSRMKQESARTCCRRQPKELGSHYLSTPPLGLDLDICLSSHALLKLQA
jgi:hypothetical protein